MQDYAQANAFIAALCHADPESVVIDFRAIHDRLKDVPAINMRGTLRSKWSEILQWNSAGYGIFCVIAATDGQGNKTQNIAYLRANYLDLDNLSAPQNYQRATAAHPAPSFAVVSSPNKYHVYWPVEPYADHDRFVVLQSKLRQVFDGDPRIKDAARVMRLPGTLHTKGEAHLVTCHALAGYGTRTTVDALETALAGVQVTDIGPGGRHSLGEPSLAAPSLEWARQALSLSDPNMMDRGEWIAFMAAWKQSAWTLADEGTLYALWLEWCSRYEKDDVGENLKQWNDITDTQLGWNSLVSRIPSLKASMRLSNEDKSHLVPAPGEIAPVIPPMPSPPPLDCSSPVLTDLECRQWFSGCVYVVNIGEMLTDDGRFLNTSQFNVAYGGKKFIWDDTGKLTDEPWKAATRSTLWQVPKVDHIRFLPSRGFGEIIPDDRGRKGVNMYKPLDIKKLAGDAGPFLRHIAAILPNIADQKILLDYLSHNVKFPGHKIPWAPVIQSAEGAGKGVMKMVMSHAMGRSYTYFPNAKQLGDSGAQFNAWMRNKLFILADEIRVDDKRDMIEILKPMISEEMIEIQGKGVDQEIEDNFSNWLFFTNWKDAVPVNKNGRRYAIFYSALQTADDLIAAGMDDAYFKRLYDWLRGDGAAIVAGYLHAYPIERGSIAMRAPDTSSLAEAVKLSRGPVEKMIIEAVEDDIPGFRGGYISTLRVMGRLKETGLRAITPQAVENILSGMGYVSLGRTVRPILQEDPVVRPQIFARTHSLSLEAYGLVQGWGA